MLVVSCTCGTVTGTLAEPHRGNPIRCECKDCQAYAAFLGTRFTDERGATPIVQVTPAQLTITAGHDQLAAVRLSDRELVRWYAACCRTPIGNTLAMDRPVFVGVVAACLPDAPPITRRINRPSGRPPAGEVLSDVIPAALFGLGLVLRAVVTGTRTSPLPRHDDPRVQVLTADERAAFTP